MLATVFICSVGILDFLGSNFADPGIWGVEGFGGELRDLEGELRVSWNVGRCGE